MYYNVYIIDFDWQVEIVIIIFLMHIVSIQY